jgi:hypothetical protein
VTSAGTIQLPDEPVKPHELVIEGDAVGGANAEIAVDDFIII